MLSALRGWLRRFRVSRRRQEEVPVKTTPRDARLAARAHFWKEVREGRREAEAEAQARRARAQS